MDVLESFVPANAVDARRTKVIDVAKPRHSGGGHWLDGKRLRGAVSNGPVDSPLVRFLASQFPPRPRQRGSHIAEGSRNRASRFVRRYVSRSPMRRMPRRLSL